MLNTCVHCVDPPPPNPQSPTQIYIHAPTAYPSTYVRLSHGIYPMLYLMYVHKYGKGAGVLKRKIPHKLDEQPPLPPNLLHAGRTIQGRTMLLHCYTIGRRAEPNSRRSTWQSPSPPSSPPPPRWRMILAHYTTCRHRSITLLLLSRLLTKSPLNACIAALNEKVSFFPYTN